MNFDNIESNLEEACLLALGQDWISSWQVGLPDWTETPGNINIPILLWLNNLIESWGMDGYAKARYSLLGKAGHWFPGENADLLDKEVQESDLKAVLFDSPWVDEILPILRKLKKTIGGQKHRRLWDE